MDSLMTSLRNWIAGIGESARSRSCWYASFAKRLFRAEGAAASGSLTTSDSKAATL